MAKTERIRSRCRATITFETSVPHEALLVCDMCSRARKRGGRGHSGDSMSVSNAKLNVLASAAAEISTA